MLYLQTCMSKGRLGQHKMNLLPCQLATQSVVLFWCICRLPSRSAVSSSSFPTSAAALASLELQLQCSTATWQWELASSNTSSGSTDIDRRHSSSNCESAGPLASVQQQQQQLLAAWAAMWHSLWHQFAVQDPHTQAQQHPQQQFEQQPLVQTGLAAGKWRQQWADIGRPLLKGVLSAPLIAGVVAISIGSCPPLQVSLWLQL